ncbi:MAG: class I SAM-dependent methyltransferase [Actinomycetota bacterium]|nr:class I SAM-dependent methyltransferase [Actinomycetota bacterium]
MSDIERAEHTWDTIDIGLVRSVAWLSLEVVNKEIWAGFSDGRGPVVRTMELLAARRPGNDLVGAALVCGDMQSERMFFEHTPSVGFRKVEGYDLSQASLDRYTPDGVEWVPHKVDCNQMELPEAAYDLVVASHGAHHVQNLEGFFAQARRSLKPNGLLYMYEWIGPTYLQIPRRNRLFAKLLLIALFPKRTTRRTHVGRVKGLRFIQDPPESFDPSEACNSLQLYPEFERNFTPLAAHFHGAITYPMFEGLAQNLAQAQPRTRKRLEFVVKAEKWLTKRKLVHPLFVVAVGERKP